MDYPNNVEWSPSSNSGAELNRIHSEQNIAEGVGIVEPGWAPLARQSAAVESNAAAIVT